MQKDCLGSSPTQKRIDWRGAPFEPADRFAGKFGVRRSRAKRNKGNSHENAFLRQTIQFQSLAVGSRVRRAARRGDYFFGDVDTLERAMHDAFGELQQHPGTALSLAYGTGTNLRKTAQSAAPEVVA
jgi:hypothetical protein